MKKIFFVVALAMTALAVNAQFYVGGSVGFGSGTQTVSEIGVSGKGTSFTLIPEVGYNLMDNLAIGVSVGYSYLGYSDYDASVSKFKFSPYARYTFLKNGPLAIFIDGGFDFASYNTNGQITETERTAWGIGLKPGIAFGISDAFSIVAHCGFLGYQSYGENSNYFGLDLTNNLSFGLYYSF